jgi:hypothetical protein
VTRGTLPDEIVWLSDAPLFIDTKQVERFYDAVVRPSAKEGVRRLEITEEKAKQIGGKLGLEVGVKPGEIGRILATVLAVVTPELKGTAEGQYQRETKAGQAVTIELHPITTPERQLEQVTAYYLVSHEDRLFFVVDPSAENWRTSDTIATVPRAIVFLQLPGQEEAAQRGLAETKIIPTAAEFANGRIELLYSRLTSRDGRQMPPAYPERADTLSALRERRREYWRWFDDNFSATRAMTVIEEAASVNGRIRWIDYRLPVTTDGDTLHLHVCPVGEYDTGVLAYNFVKRGHKHGLRIVGTLKSEPDMNVLAIYDR